MKKIVLSVFSISFLFAACGDKEDSNTQNETVKEETVNVLTFQEAKVGFGDNLTQSLEGTYTFPSDQENIKSIKVFIKDICPNKLCDEWDRYANLYVKDKTSDVWYEIGRFITPYWVGTEKLERGLEIDVTDFKSLLSGETQLKIYTETWSSKGRTYTVDFDVEYGKPDYKYYSVAPIMQYNLSSLHGVPYGKPHDKDLTKNITLPESIEAAHLRTIISGWGHARPGNCAEWCFRTHHIWLNNSETFEHDLAPLDCANNPINNQSPGNWQGDRAGWCPGMVVPNRIDILDASLFNSSFNYKYKFEEWTDNGQNENGAFYAISSFIIAKSNSVIDKPTVED